MTNFFSEPRKKIGNHSFKSIKVVEGTIIYRQKYYNQRLVFTVALHGLNIFRVTKITEVSKNMFYSNFLYKFQSGHS